MRNYKACIVLTFLLTYFAEAQQSVTVKLNEQTMTGPVGVLNFGLVGQDEIKSATLAVTNVSSKTLVVDVFGFGDNVAAEWADETALSRLATRTSLTPGKEAKLNISVLFDDGVEQYPLVTLSSGTRLATIEIGYSVVDTRPFLARYPAVLPSGLGEWHSPMYHLCLGPAIPHHTLDTNSVTTFMKSTNGDHERHCGYFSTCDVKPKDDSNVCFNVSIQGHHENVVGKKDGNNEVLDIQLGLTARYNFVPTPPVLE